MVEMDQSDFDSIINSLVGDIDILSLSSLQVEEVRDDVEMSPAPVENKREINCISYDLPGAILKYYPNFLHPQEADFYFETFRLLPFVQGRVSGGEEKRLSRFYSEVRAGDKLKEYYYSGKVNVPLPFTAEMTELRDQVSTFTGYPFNSCLVNHYRDGRDVIGAHSDSEKSLVVDSAIASISLGATRFFDVMPKECAPNPNIPELRIPLLHGSLVIMAGTCQKYYKHAVPQQTSVKDPRINLTFRLSH